MRKKIVGMFLFIYCLTWITVVSHAQYTVTGGNGIPFIESRKPLDVYLVYGTQHLTISYTSTTNMSHQWYRYRTKALEAEMIPSLQSGKTSTITEVEEGYGYFVKDPDKITSFVWIIDYSKHLSNISGLHISNKSDPCHSLFLEYEGDIPDIWYYTPTGDRSRLERDFEVVYNTLDIGDDFKIKKITKTIHPSGSLFEPSIEAPYCDTDVHVEGDQYARYFNKIISICMNDYEASAVTVCMDTLLIEQDAPNINREKDGYCAPVTIRFTARANTPTAGLFFWKIYKEGEESDPFVRFVGEEVDYTFRQAGNFVAKVEIISQTGTCKIENEVGLKVSESYLLIPNAFSPGTSPGINDEFRVAYKSLIHFQGWIFNRWGEELFRWTNPSQGWNGRKNGKYVAPGVYFYVIEAEGSDGIKYKEKGDINILRSKTIQEKNENSQE